MKIQNKYKSKQMTSKTQNQTPLAFPGDVVFIENHKSRQKLVEKGKVITTRSVWSGPNFAIHQYKVKLDRQSQEGKRIVIDINGHGIKQVISNRIKKQQYNEITN